MTPREANDYSHLQPRPAVVVDCVHRATGGKCWQPESLLRSNHNVASFHCGTGLVRAPNDRRCVSLRRVQSTVAFVECEWGRVSCTEQYRSERSTLAKPSDRIVGRPTHLSVMSSPISQSAFYGLKTQRRTSHRLPNAACAKPSASSAAAANGRAMPSPRSSPKFSFVDRCATSA